LKPLGAVRFGIDIGGTFTDLVAIQDGRVIGIEKVLTTPEDPSIAVAEGVRVLLARTLPDQVTEVVHGTTLVPNALIERKGALTALLTTRGFRDTLEMRREHRYDLYDLGIRLPEPLVPRRLRWEVSERILGDGTIDIEIDLGEVESLAARALDEGVEAIAICFLHSYRNARHEQAAAELIRRVAPSIPVSISSDVVPEIGEYVRTSTTVANAYVQPTVDRYLAAIEDNLRSVEICAPMHVMLSSGGLTDVESARDHPIRMSESGPAAGVIAAAYIGRRAGHLDVLAFDMGGTTAKACLIESGAPLIARQHEVARVDRFLKESGLPIRTSVVDLIEIGAGGGSIARVGEFGLPKVGPRSAASVPGPACYAGGGTEPTVTDADLLLGYLDPDFFLGGAMRLETRLAETAIGAMAGKLKLSVVEAAAGIHRVVNENMAAAARMHAIERGRDLRGFTLVATGGAGPVHAWGVAKSLGVKRIIFPPSAGVASAIGMLVAPPAFDFSRSRPSLLAEVDWKEVLAELDEMRGRGMQLLTRVGVPSEALRVVVQADLHYHGQGEPTTVDLGSELRPQGASDHVARCFEKEYAAVFGRLPEGMEVEVLTWRLRIEGPWQSVDPPASSGATRKLKGRRPIYSEEQADLVEADVIDRYALLPGDVVHGPAVVEERESTVVIGVGGVATVDPELNLVVAAGG
jgi:N-methylhydantoinase A/oxoprolinase/acetone carboxylase beta subunit